MHFTASGDADSEGSCATLLVMYPSLISLFTALGFAAKKWPQFVFRRYPEQHWPVLTEATQEFAVNACAMTTLFIAVAFHLTFMANVSESSMSAPTFWTALGLFIIGHVFLVIQLIRKKPPAADYTNVA